jgi:hypothetical protein
MLEVSLPFYRQWTCTMPLESELLTEQSLEHVATAQRNNSIAGQKRALPDPERVSLSEAARICGG